MAEKEYIEREAARLAYEKSLANDNHRIEGASAIHRQEHRHMLHILEKLIAADVVEVVRCGKCKFFFEDCCNHPENRIAYRVPDFGDHYVYAGRIKCEPDHFCGRGERKEQT